LGTFASAFLVAVDSGTVRVTLPFKPRHNRRGNPTTEGKIAFRGPRNPPNLPKVKLDLTGDEVVPTTPVDREIAHPYSDGAGWSTVRCYSIVDLLAEKLRALAERCRPRGLYDVVHLHRHADLTSRAADVAASLKQKCAHAGIDVPTHASIQATPFRADVERQLRSYRVDRIVGAAVTSQPFVHRFIVEF